MPVGNYRLERPRVRQGEQEVPLATYQQFQAEDPLTERAMEQMLVGVSTRKYARSLEPLVPSVEESGTSKSAVSRHFVARTEAQLEVTLGESLKDREWVALMVDGLHFHDHLILILLGIDGGGQTLTVTKLGLTGALCKTLETTNPIENLNGGVRRVGGRVKRCRDGRMALRWVVTAALEAARTFRRLKGHRDLPKLIAALRARDAEMNRDNVRPAV